MKIFLQRLLLFVLIPAVLLLSIVLISNSNYFPAPMVSNSFSFNEKLFALENFEAKYLAFGSSITLNNLDATEVKRHFNTEDFLNLGSWGMSVLNTYDLIRVYTEIFKPEVIIMVSNVEDFFPTSIQFDPSEVGEIMQQPEGFYDYLYVKYPKLSYYVRRYFGNKAIYGKRNVYDSMEFDENGSVMLSMDGFAIDSSRWNHLQDLSKIDPVNYSHLDSLCQYLSDQGKRFIFMQSPVRSSLRNAEYDAGLQEHITRVKTILHKYGHTFLDSSQEKWADSGFVDAGHLNESGAKLFTQTLLGQLSTN